MYWSAMRVLNRYTAFSWSTKDKAFSRINTALFLCFSSSAVLSSTSHSSRLVLSNRVSARNIVQRQASDYCEQVMQIQKNVKILCYMALILYLHAIVTFGFSEKKNKTTRVLNFHGDKINTCLWILTTPFDAALCVISMILLSQKLIEIIKVIELTIHWFDEKCSERIGWRYLIKKKRRWK